VDEPSAVPSSSLTANALATAKIGVDGGVNNALFDIQSSIGQLVRLSHGWSCREIRKVIQNIQSSVLGSAG
jgi:hypothetical protein